jgi:hypothetical protein
VHGFMGVTLQTTPGLSGMGEGRISLMPCLFVLADDSSNRAENTSNHRTRPSPSNASSVVPG